MDLKPKAAYLQLFSAFGKVESEIEDSGGRSNPKLRTRVDERPRESGVEEVFDNTTTNNKGRPKRGRPKNGGSPVGWRAE